jgi:Holliday junction DNA helicase RuvA
MYDRITGVIVEKTPTRVVLEASGVGYDINVPVSTSSKLPALSRVTLFLHFHVREDSLRLYGFATQDERKLFRALLTVSGVGPQTALAVLSGSSVEHLSSTIVNEDHSSLCRIRGIGRKTAERIILELKEQVKLLAPSFGVSDKSQLVRQDAILALLSLGYTRAQAQAAVEKAAQKVQDATTEQLVKTALEFA